MIIRGIAKLSTRLVDEMKMMKTKLSSKLLDNYTQIAFYTKNHNKPMGISEFTFNELPQNIQDNMPTIEELENELKKLN